MNKKLKVMTLLAMLLLSTLLFLTPTCVYAETLTWRIETLTTDGDSYAGSITLDSYDRPHLTYEGPKDWISNWRSLKYKWWDGSKWISDTVDASEDCGYDSSIVLDSYDRPHISHMTRHFDQIRYAKWTGTGWVTDIVYSTDPTGLSLRTSIALDSFGNPHITFGDGYLEYASWTGTDWNIETVDPEYGRGGFSSLAFDSFDNPHISYLDATNDRVMYVRWTGTGWSTPDPVDPFPNPWSTSIAIDSSNNPHITFSSPLKYASWTGTDWSITTVDPIAVEGSSMALDSQDRPHISYFASTNLDLKYAWWDGTDWNIETVDSDDWVGRDSCIALDSFNNPHITYDYFDPDPWTCDVRYATLETTPPEVVDVIASDSDGHFSVTINAGADKGAPVTDWWELDTTNIASYTVTLTDGDMVLVVEGQLNDPSLPGQIVLQVDPPGEVITYSIDVEPLSRDALWNRLVEIILAWPTSTPEQRAELWEDIVEIILLWPTAP